ncbi:MAG: hypothetical protein U5J99_03035 [Parvularculaceae bacterium]|nr:hypothetical protein [Parvularculaceae bacterium]
MKALALFFAISLLALPASAEKVTPLFASLDPIDITITGPVTRIIQKAASSTDPLPATLTIGEETHSIELSARGNSRRRPEACTFPPLRVRLSAAPPEGSLFRKQKALKLVTHCRAQKAFQQHTLLEYAAYRMYNEVTEASFRVRLANVRYVDSGSGKLVAEKPGFFIEDADDVAARNGLKELEAGALAIDQHDAAAAARAVLFFHMIANHDWSMLAGPEGGCCHNGKLLGASKTTTAGLTYLPYDFDYSGFVDTPYAAPPDDFGISSVKTRHYRGACALNAAVTAAAPQFRARRAAIEEAIRTTPGLDRKSVDRAVKFLDGFYDDIEDEAAIAKLVKRCR